MRASALLAAVLMSAAAPANEIRPEPPQVEELGREGDARVWRTRRFRIEADFEPAGPELRRIAKVADTTLRAMEAFPLPLFRPADEQPRLVIRRDDAGYRAAGGARDTAGMYLARRGYVILHAGHLFRNAERGRIGPGADEDLIVHEIVHLGMHRVQPGLPQWLAEGLCEYFAAAHRGGGVFGFDDMERAIAEHVRDRFDPADPAVKALAVADLAGLDGSGWSDFLETRPVAERHHAYVTALLLTHYHLHGSPARRATLRAALTAKRRKPADILGGREPGELETTLARYWKPRGLAVTFAEPHRGPDRPEETTAPAW